MNTRSTYSVPVDLLRVGDIVDVRNNWHLDRKERRRYYKVLYRAPSRSHPQQIGVVLVAYSDLLEPGPALISRYYTRGRPMRVHRRRKQTPVPKIYKWFKLARPMPPSQF